MVLLCHIIMFAQGGQTAILQHGDEFKTFYSASALRDALAVAEAGDVINLSAGTFQGGTINVPVTVRGAGIGALDSVENVSTARTSISSNVYINIPENTNGHTLSMEGMICEKEIKITNATTPQFSKMRIRGNFGYGDNFDGDVLKNVTFFHCILDGQVLSAEKATISFYNSIVNRISTRTMNVIEVNNSIVLDRNSGEFGLVYNNCIVDQSNVTNPSVYGISCYNCLGIASKDLFTDDNSKDDRNNKMFPADKKVFKEGTFYRLTDEAAAYLGSDGTQVGIYGTTLPFSTKTSYPQLKKFAVAPESGSDGKLKIEIEIDAD